MATFFTERGHSGPRMSEEALEKVVLMASAFVLSEDGYIDHVRVLKDVPRTEFFYEQTNVSFWNHLTGYSAFNHWTMLAHTRGLPANSLDPTLVINSTLEQVGNDFGTINNIWIVILVHVEVWIVCVFLVVGLIQHWDAPCLVVSSSKVRLSLVGN
jgi:hypothetical protein